MQTFSTNEICELCQVSRKQLRYYEEKGLLSQVPRHSGNNYRYYTHEHIYEIVAAKAMRDIDMPLGEMKDIIYGRNVASIQNSLQQQMDSAKEALEISLRRLCQAGRGPVLFKAAPHPGQGGADGGGGLSGPGRGVIALSGHL